MAAKEISVKKYVVRLSGERERLEALLRKGKSPAQRLLKASKADVSQSGEGWSDSRIIEALETRASMVYRVRKQLVEEGFEAVLSRKQRASLDHLVGAGEERRWHVEAERLGSLQVDHQLELGRLLNWKVGRFGSLENPARVSADASVCIGETGPVAHEAASLCELAPLIDRGYPMVRCQTNELIAPISEEGIRADKDRAHALLDNGRKGGFDFAFAARIQDYNLLPMERAAA